MKETLIIAGFGGQGVLSMGKILAYSGVMQDYEVTWMPSYGPEMRGGTANVTVILSDKKISSPIAHEFDTAIILNQQSMEKFEPLVKPGGILIYDTNGITRHPVRKDIEVYTIDATAECARMGQAKLFNTMILGGYLKVRPIVKMENVMVGLKKSLPERAWKMLPQNEEAIRHGGEIIKNIITNLDFTGGALGLNTNPIYSNAKKLLPYAVILVLLTVLVMMNLKRSKQGRAIMAIRDNRIAAESVGIDVTRYKLMVFMLAAFFAGAAGVLYGHFFANVKAATFDYNMSIEILVIVVLGGMGSIPGSIIAAIVLTALPEAMREFADYRMLLYAIVLIIVMLATNNPTMKEFFHRISPAELLRHAKKKKAKSLQKEGA